MRIIKNKSEIDDFIVNINIRGGGIFENTNNENNEAIKQIVTDIINDVVKRKDEAVKEYTLKFDCVNTQYYRVPDEVLSQALQEADKDFINALKRCKINIEAFHEKQKNENYTVRQGNDIILKQRITPLERVGIYVPGGTAAYPSSVLMNAIPAKIAGVKEIIMATPPQKDGTPNPDILAAAKLCGVDKVFLCGGAQAIAALATGTEEIPRVDKIVGPGNIYVATAKRLLYGIIDIDMIAGPSEILIIADEKASPRYIAADLLSQAEHDTLASAVLITTSKELAEDVNKELSEQLKTLPRKSIAEESLSNYGAVIIADDLEDAVELANGISPEHCEVLIINPFELEDKLINVGSLFLGEYAPEPLGDYFAGPNHVLPTNGTARFFSPLGVDSFIKKSNSIYYSKNAFEAAADDIMLIAQREGLGAHANSIKVRCEN
ncbi:MAG: histidinol dehydrogenase [Oscillospiraceae bacterium]|nr:histidinol dehydrogenase [Oscillospiraceae bacterium]